jgi:hypothetical protein
VGEANGDPAGVPEGGVTVMLLELEDVQATINPATTSSKNLMMIMLHERPGRGAGCCPFPFGMFIPLSVEREVSRGRQRCSTPN